MDLAVGGLIVSIAVRLPVLLLMAKSGYLSVPVAELSVSVLANACRLNGTYPIALP